MRKTMSKTQTNRQTMAMKLKQVADSKHQAKNQEKRDMIYNHLLEAASTAAEEGRYSYELYDEGLAETNMIASLKQLLEVEGFKVDGGIDHNYSEHVRKDMWYIRISW